MSEYLPSSNDIDALSIGFHRFIQTREQKLTHQKGTKGNYQVGNFLKDFLGFPEHQESATYGLG